MITYMLACLAFVVAIWSVCLHGAPTVYHVRGSTTTMTLILIQPASKWMHWATHGRPGPLLNQGTSQCNACRGIRWWSIRITCPSQRSLLSLSMSSILYCPVLTTTYIIEILIIYAVVVQQCA